MWQEFIQGLTPKCKFTSPSSMVFIDEAEKDLGLEFTDELRSLLRESNGVVGEYGLGVVWPVERIRADNLEFRYKEDFRRLYMPFDHLLFFGDNGCGDQFAYAINGGCIRRTDVFCWEHENDSRTWAAPSLKKYLEWYLTSRLKL